MTGELDRGTRRKFLKGGIAATAVAVLLPQVTLPNVEAATPTTLLAARLPIKGLLQNESGKWIYASEWTYNYIRALAEIENVQIHIHLVPDVPYEGGE